MRGHSDLEEDCRGDARCPERGQRLCGVVRRYEGIVGCVCPVNVGAWVEEESDKQRCNAIEGRPDGCVECKGPGE